MDNDNDNDNDNATMGGPLSEADRARLAVIRAHFESANVDVPLDAPMKERTARVSAGIGLMTNGREYTEFLLELVGVLEGQLATASEELERQRWYGEQLQMSIEGCSGNHHEIEEYPGDSAALGLDGGGSDE